MVRLPPQRVLIAVAAFLALIGVVAAVAVGRTNPVDNAIEVVEDDAQFNRAADAGVAFIRISRVLSDAAGACENTDKDDPCRAWLQAAGYAQVAAVEVINCTRPGIFEHREKMRGYLHELRDDVDARVPNLPKSCIG